MPTTSDTSADSHDESDADSCLCGIEHIEDEFTSDAELPPAIGGIRIEVAADVDHHDDDEDDVDGCDLDFGLDDVTSDAELPAAIGGV
ncbi:hypothetical protein HL666_16560 [Bradyrhizobium sp. 83002]|uniref:hypothetical protein n=1 Tax=Bradyrhizobium aeschynomenes TaxID=2734909 RepID=UPI00155597E0|nr:hypothetical protein [Bradyrhizobium aeschynomenes]NPU12384.1 hypothetical protein [Bradyrhizobium aeschynomenes]NPV22942.1 hypothetical protein [Bradyrhizobium aeschynomenes]